MEFNLNQPHDLIFRATLSDQRRADAILRAHLQPWLAALLADELPVPLDGTFVDEELRSSQSDKLLQVTLRSGQPAFVYALLEHKSYSDPGTALQMWKYKARIWEAYARGEADRLRALPAIVPLVFYHGRQPWTAPRSIAAMVSAQDERLQDLEPTFGYFLRDLGHIPVERTRGRPGGAGRLACAALFPPRRRGRGREAGCVAGDPSGPARRIGLCEASGGVSYECLECAPVYIEREQRKRRSRAEERRW